MKATAQWFAWIVALALASLTLSCSTTMTPRQAAQIRQDLLGQWQEFGDLTFVEFFPNGQLRFASGGAVSQGSYRIVGDRQLLLELGGRMSVVVEVKVSKTRMTWTNGKNEKFQYGRIK